MTTTEQAARFVEALRLNADGYHMGIVAPEDFRTSEEGIWAEIRDAGREVLAEVSRMLRGAK